MSALNVVSMLRQREIAVSDVKGEVDCTRHRQTWPRENGQYRAASSASHSVPHGTWEYLLVAHLVHHGRWLQRLCPSCSQDRGEMALRHSDEVSMHRIRDARINWEKYWS